MDFSSPPSSSAVPPPPLQEAGVKREDLEKETVHRMKLIQFFGRTTPIILQNDNGPCPLIAICNVLSLKNSLNLSLDIAEVSQEKLLSLIAERLIDSNSNVNNKDAGFVENQQQNIADAIDLLPRLTTGIDVNIKFRRIEDFEFTPECTIFDLLDIPLYHGWIVDPQDSETADAIGSKSYNTLMGELVSLETQTLESEQKRNLEDDSIDFVAATTAALGVPSPCLSRGQSFNDPPCRARKGDAEEEAELLRVLKLSEAESSSLVADGIVANRKFEESECIKKSELAMNLESVENNAIDEIVMTGTLITGCDAPIENEYVQSLSFEEASPSASSNFQDKFRSHEQVQNKCTSTSDQDEQRNPPNDCKTGDSSSLLISVADRDSSSAGVHKIDKPKAFNPSIDRNEPLYEGEDCILESETAYENQEPVYEGEVVLAEQVAKICRDDGDHNGRISSKQGELIRNFIKNSASQLTVYGLFCLQDKVKECELCVFFRNNHFNTMFKYEGELYILTTDQGCISQPDLVWEKLNEVNGDTLYMTGNFREFKLDDHSDGTWDRQNAMVSQNSGKYTSSSSKQESKSKEKCIVM